MNPADAMLLRRWPEVVAVQYAGQSELTEANSTEESAQAFLELINSTGFGMSLGVPTGGDIVALAYLTTAITAMCVMDHPSALRLLRAAIAEIEKGRDTHAQWVEMQEAFAWWKSRSRQ